MASLPSEWQLRFMAYIRLIRLRPWLSEKLRAFYRLRRERFIAQLQRIDAEQHLFAADLSSTMMPPSITGASCDQAKMLSPSSRRRVSLVCPALALATTDDYVRFSIGVIPVPEVPLTIHLTQVIPCSGS